jgi:uncharacterized membrane protein YfcA
MSDYDVLTIAWCAASLAAAGVVKGVLGIGIPLVSIALLSLMISVPEAVVLLPVPILVANTWQAFRGGHFRPAVRRFWPLIAALVAGTAVGALMLKRVDTDVLQIIIGSAVIVFALTSLTNPELRLPAGAERWAGALAGGLGGVLGGMSTLYGPPIIMYLVSLHLPKDQFVGFIGTLYLIGAIVLLVMLAGFRVMGPAELAASALATPPLLAGMLVGQWLRDRVSQALFKKGLLITVMVIGANLLIRAVI